MGVLAGHPLHTVMTGDATSLHLLVKTYDQFSRLLIPVWQEDFAGDWARDFFVDEDRVRRAPSA